VPVDRALRLLGVGAFSIVAIPTDDRFRMRPDALRAALASGDGPTIVVAQAGEVNTGAFDPSKRSQTLVKDGRVAARRRRVRAVGSGDLVAGSERADSWATDAHKCGYVASHADARHLRDARTLRMLQAGKRHFEERGGIEAQCNRRGAIVSPGEDRTRCGAWQS
jgi:glutamate/tyrosine decarboxylase-like PLP-dependent enzyme